MLLYVIRHGDPIYNPIPSPKRAKFRQKPLQNDWRFMVLTEFFLPRY